MTYDVCHGKRREWAGADYESNRQDGSPDNNDGTIVGSNGFARRLKQQSTNEGGTRGEMVMTASGDDD
jgi:hypothetical protein